MTNWEVNISIQTPKANKIEFSDDKIEEIRKFRTFSRRFTQDAVGLAANQTIVNGKIYNENFFVSLREPDGIYINPEILMYMGRKRTVLERCLSHPNKTIEVQRYDHIYIKYTDINMVEHFEFINGNAILNGTQISKAQLIQHEVDHLQGVFEKVVRNISSTKIGRNAPCPCGKPIKYKNCCGNYN